MAILSGYYNYYNDPSRYHTDKPLTAWYDKEADTDSIHSNNDNNRDSELAAECRKLEATYSGIAESNRCKYSTKREVINGVYQKYFNSSMYDGYSREEKSAMYENEVEMTLYGEISTAANDPHLKGKVEVNKGTKAGYNDEMVNTQFNNVLLKAGINFSVLSNYNFSLSIDAYSYQVTVSGLNDEELSRQVEAALSTGNNAKQFMSYLFRKEKEAGCFSKEQEQKYYLVNEFKNITGEDLREYKQTEDGFIRSDGKNAIDVYKDALRTTKEVPAQYKGAAFDYFQSMLEKASTYDFSSTKDLVLSTNYESGVLGAAQSGISMYSSSGNTDGINNLKPIIDIKA